MKARNIVVKGAMLAATAIGGTAMAMAPASASTATHDTSTAQLSGASPSCTRSVKTLGNGVHVRTAPNTGSTVVGETFKGQKFTAYCSPVNGGLYTACAGRSTQWVHLKFNGHWRYSPYACYEYILG